MLCFSSVCKVQSESLWAAPSLAVAISLTFLEPLSFPVIPVPAPTLVGDARLEDAEWMWSRVLCDRRDRRSLAFYVTWHFTAYRRPQKQTPQQAFERLKAGLLSLSWRHLEQREISGKGWEEEEVAATPDSMMEGLALNTQRGFELLTLREASGPEP